MKRVLCVILATLSLVLCACDGTSLNDTESDTEEKGAITLDTDVADTDVTDTNSSETETIVKELKMTKYMPTSVLNDCKKWLSQLPALMAECDMSKAPFTMKDVYNISNCKVRSVTIPVFRVTESNSQGDYILTAYVVKNSFEGLKNKALREYKIAVNGKNNGLSDNSNVSGFITVDVSDLDIVLRNDETLSFGSKADTVVLSRITSEIITEVIAVEFPQALGSFFNVGSQSLDVSTDTLLFDFELEHEEELDIVSVSNDAEYNELVAALSKKYKGKYVSVLGDSISTYSRVSDNKAYNHTLSSNLTYYTGNRLPVMDVTYWGRLLSDAGLKLCVNNSSSGASVFGKSELLYKDAAVLRCVELDNDNGTPTDSSDDISPDLIIFYMGTNDVNMKKYGELYSKLIAVDRSKYREVIGVWFKDVLARSSNATLITPNEGYTSFEQAYALTLYRMKQKYSKADIVCIDVMYSKAYKNADTDKLNFCIAALAEYFEVALLKQKENAVVSEYNNHATTIDIHCIHPNAKGHYLLSKELMKVLTEK